MCQRDSLRETKGTKISEKVIKDFLSLYLLFDRKKKHK